MFAPFILPVLLTGLLFLAARAIAFTVAPAFRKQVDEHPVLVLLLSFAAFVPACEVTTAVVDSYRYGTFRYPDAASVGDRHIRRYLPPTAVDIVIEEYPSGHAARFKVARADLDRWFDEVWAADSAGSMTLQKPPKPNGAGFTLRYELVTGNAYEEAAYW